MVALHLQRRLTFYDAGARTGRRKSSVRSSARARQAMPPARYARPRKLLLPPSTPAVDSTSAFFPPKLYVL